MNRQAASVARKRSKAKREAASRPPSVQSVDRAMHVLEVLGEDGEGYRLADLAVRTALSPSTVHRLLTTLEQRHFVLFDGLASRWHVGRQMFAIGRKFVSKRGFVASSMPVLRRLRDQTRETSNLGVAEADSVVLLAQVESRELVRAVSAVGGNSPMTSDALGKALLAAYPDEEVARIIHARGMRRATPSTITRASDLRKELASIRSNGYALDRGELYPELHCVAAPIFDAQSEAIAAISISGLASRMPDARIASLGRMVREAAEEVTNAIGWHFAVETRSRAIRPSTNRAGDIGLLRSPSNRPQPPTRRARHPPPHAAPANR